MKWNAIKDKLPDRNTRYSGEFGVSVLCFDEDEYLDSGYFNPCLYIFDFGEQFFKTLAYGENDTMWVQASVTHWTELPEIPKGVKPNG